MINGFSVPPAENRPRPFWFFNGDLDRDEIRRQILEMKAKGLGGFFLCARQGLRVPYLSQEWFNLCRYTVSIARENGLEVWLYDEYPYPSGMSGGEVTIRRPDVKQHEISLLARNLAEGESLEESLGEADLLFAAAYPVTDGAVQWERGEDIAAHAGILQNQEIYQITEGGASYKNSVKRYFTYGPSKELRWKNPGGRWHVVVAYTREMSDFKYYGTFIDPANPDAVQCFLDTTYEPYKAVLGEDFGATVKGMFGDETSIHGHWPWTRQLPGYFRGQYGYDLIPHLAALTDKTYPNAMRIRYQYFQCIHELLRDRYHKVLSAWCEKNGIRYVTEVPSVRMSNQMYSHIPGGDPCHDKLGYRFEDVIDRDFQVMRQNPKIISAMARQFGRRDSLIEGFHSIGWTKTLQDAKWQIDRQTLMGISLHNFHAYYYTVNGITKHDAPPSQFIQNPYWEHYKAFADYCGRSSRFITETEASTRVAVLHPAVSWLSQMRHPFRRFGYIGADPEEEALGQKLLDDYKAICKAMFFGQIDYDDLDPEVMAMGKVEKGLISVGRAGYHTLVIPPVTCMEPFAFDLIRKFSEGGGKVVLAGLTPYDSLAEGFDPAKAFSALGILPRSEYCGAAGAPSWERRGNISLVHTPGGIAASGAGETIAEAVRFYAPNDVEAVIPAKYRRDIITHRREADGIKFIMISSQNGVRADTKAVFRNCPAGAFFYELDLETGAVYSREAAETADGFVVDAPLTPWTSRIIAMSAERHDAVPYPGGSELRLALNLNEPVPVKPEGLNVYRLESLTVSIDGSEDIPSKPNTFIEHFREIGCYKPGHLHFSQGFGLPRRLSVSYPIQAVYRFRFRVDGQITAPGKGSLVKVLLMRDRMGVGGEHTIAINGRELPAEAFSPVRIYDQNNIAADVSRYLTGGVNEIVVLLTASKDWHGVSDPMYLLGDFGVLRQNGDFVIGKAPETAAVTAKAVDGYPFYSGKMTYDCKLICGELSGCEQCCIELPEEHRIYECVGLELNGTPLGVRTFSPYVWHCDAALLKEGSNRVRLTVANTLGNMLEGVYYDYDEKKTVMIRP